MSTDALSAFAADGVSASLRGVGTLGGPSSPEPSAGDPATRPSPRPRPGSTATNGSDSPAVADAENYVSYAEFGENFFRTAITPSRVEQATSVLAGQPIDFGPAGVGPGGFVRVRAEGAVGAPSVSERRHPELVAFDASLPIDLRLTIEIGPDRTRFHAKVLVRLSLTARAAAPLVVVLDVAEPGYDDVEVDLHADGVRASLVKVVGNVEHELRRTVLRVVRKELASEQVVAARHIDVARALERLDAPRRGNS